MTRLPILDSPQAQILLNKVRLPLNKWILYLELPLVVMPVEGKRNQSLIVLSAPDIHPFKTSAFPCKGKTRFILGLSHSPSLYWVIQHFFLKQMTYLLDKKRDLSWPKEELSKRHRSAVSSYNLHCTTEDITGHVCSLKHLS